MVRITDGEKCDDCAGLFAEDEMFHTEDHGTLCPKCYKKEFKHHILLDPEAILEPEDIAHIPLPAELSPGCVSYDPRTGLAGISLDGATFEANKGRATKILQKAFSDVDTVERNERYGSIME